ncbi:hypothetical protein OG689_44170 [Kitasatospora sp. NBC_00240]|uniref:helix-turn-helix domain-containing protein n=1 Tax=Kitasatospora sp. NBC_00240 TaxID=2903567 RepID=UPI00224FD8F1|nr:helix-turn-helix domain-containing protein [Kitasatospora sp. NBC_00240]MCX5216134.1 hypothetical protein [Kitasatospora sp. NBC_00240]
MGDSSEIELASAALPPARDASSEADLRRRVREAADAAAGDLARELRRLVDGRPESHRYLAEAMGINSGTMSKYMNGQHVPDWTWIRQLLELTARLGSEKVTEETRTRIYAAQQRALELKHPMRYQVHTLEMTLEGAEQELRGLRSRVAELLGDLGDAQRKLEGLRAEQEQDREQQEQRVAQLLSSLDTAVARMRALREKCAGLEEQLKLARTAAARHSVDPDQPAGIVPVEGAFQGGSTEAEFLQYAQDLVSAYLRAKSREERHAIRQRTQALTPQGLAALLAVVERIDRERGNDELLQAFTSTAGVHDDCADVVTALFDLLPEIPRNRVLQHLVASTPAHKVGTLVVQLLAQANDREAEAVAGATVLRRDLPYCFGGFSVAGLNLLAAGLTDAVLIEHLHAMERAEPEWMRGPVGHYPRIQIRSMLALTVRSTPLLAAARIELLSPDLRGEAFDVATSSSYGFDAQHLGNLACALRRGGVRGTGKGKSDLATELLTCAAVNISDQEVLADFITHWRQAAEDQAKPSSKDLALLLSEVLRSGSSQRVRQLLTHAIALPPGSTSLNWHEGRVQWWLEAARELGFTQRRVLLPILGDMEHLASRDRDIMIDNARRS